MEAGGFYVVGLSLIGFFRWSACARNYTLDTTEKHIK